MYDPNAFGPRPEEDAAWKAEQDRIARLPKQPFWQGVRELIVLALVVLAAIVAFRGASVFLPFVIRRIALVFPHLIRPGLIAALLVAAVGMYQFKKHGLFYYGQVAIAFGLFSGSKVIYAWSGSTRLANIIALAGALYVIVRGIEDFDKGRVAKKVTA